MRARRRWSRTPHPLSAEPTDIAFPEGEMEVRSVPPAPKSRSALLISGGFALALAGLVFWKRKEISTMANTVLNAGDFVKQMWGALSDSFPSMSMPTKLIIIAHGAYESGWGVKAAIKQGAANNMFNITAGNVTRTDAWDGQRLTVKNADRKYAPKGAPQPGPEWQLDTTLNQWWAPIDQVWRVYPDYATAVKDYYSFLGPNQNGGRYVKARAALDAGDVATFARELGNAGYYDKNIIDTYTKQLAAVVETVKKYLLS